MLDYINRLYSLDSQFSVASVVSDTQVAYPVQIGAAFLPRTL